MAVHKIGINEFLALAPSHPVLDVRSPGEFNRAHIPGAYSLPLFTDEERKVVGTAYKQESRQAAIKIGLDFFGGKMRKMVEEVERLFSEERELNPAFPTQNPVSAPRTVLVHCWRGGMRSAGVAWLLDLYGFKVYTLVGGYKKFRHWVIDTYSRNYHFKILGGYTGSGKTYVLDELRKQGERVVDLEGIAKHKGSAFGNIGMPEQPSQEMFENLLAMDLHKVTTEKGMEEFLPKPIWLEDESQRIGLINLPMPFWKQMRESEVIFIDIPFEERLKHIVKEYGVLDRQRMMDAIQRIQKRLGPLETKTSLQMMRDDDLEGSFRILLKYYDKWYSKGLNNRERLNELLKLRPCDTVDAVNNAKTVLSKQFVS